MQTHRFPNFAFSYPSAPVCPNFASRFSPPWLRIWSDGKSVTSYRGHADHPTPLRPNVWSQASPRFRGRLLWLLSHSAGQINYCAHTLSARTTSLATALHACCFTLRKRLSCTGGRTQERDIKPWIAIGVHILFNIVFSNVWGSLRDTGGALLQMAYV